MKEIVLRNLPAELQRLVKWKALNDDISREQAVVEFLHDAEIQRAVDHDIAIMEAKFEKEEEPF
jgi:hypothetical protein